MVSPFPLLDFNLTRFISNVGRAVRGHDDVKRNHLLALMDRTEDRIVLHVVPVLCILDTEVERARRINHDVLGLAAAIVLRLWRIEWLQSIRYDKIRW